MSSEQISGRAPVHVRQVPVTVYDPPGLGFSAQDLTELGATLASAGLAAGVVRSLIAKVQQAAAQTATAVMPELLEELRKVQAARLQEICSRIRLLPVMAGYVSRERVMQVIQDVASRVPQS